MPPDPLESSDCILGLWGQGSSFSSFFLPFQFSRLGVLNHAMEFVKAKTAIVTFILKIICQQLLQTSSRSPEKTLASLQGHSM